MNGTLLAGSLAGAHKFDCEKENDAKQTNPNTDTAHGVNINEKTNINEKGIGQMAKVGQDNSTKTLIEVATTQRL